MNFVSQNWFWILLAIGLLLFVIRVDDEIIEAERKDEKRQRKISLARQMLRRTRKGFSEGVYRP